MHDFASSENVAWKDLGHGQHVCFQLFEVHGSSPCLFPHAASKDGHNANMQAEKQVHSANCTCRVESISYSRRVWQSNYSGFTAMQELIEENATMNAIDALFERFNRHTTLAQLQYIHEVRHVFQYSLNPAHDLLRWDQRAQRDHHDDAFTFTMKAVMRNLCARHPHLLPLQCLVGSS